MKQADGVRWEIANLSIGLLAAVIGLVFTVFSKGFSIDGLSIVVSVVSFIVSVTFITKWLFGLLRRDVLGRLDYINDRLERDYASWWGIDGKKVILDKKDMYSVWPKLTVSATKYFVAVNYLSHDNWVDRKGDELASSLGLMRVILGEHEFSARRIFIVDSIKELEKWDITFAWHRYYGIEFRYMLKKDYDIERDKHDSNKIFSNTVGFNVLDPARPGVVVDWRYEGRETSGAIFQKGSSVATQYSELFEHLWTRKCCKSVEKISARIGLCKIVDCGDRIVS